MTQPTGTIRPLFFPLDQSEDLRNETPNTPTIEHITLDDWQTEDPDERVNIVLNLSLNEYVALATCVDVGRDIAYGNESLYLWWIWVRTLKYMDLCDLILECIETSEGLQQAIAKYSTTLQPNADTPENDTIGNTDLFGGQQTGCDNDKIFGMTTGLTDLLNTIITDVFEVINTGTNISSTIGDLIEAIPGIGILPYDDILQFIDKVVDNLSAAYAGAYDTQMRDDIRCGMFCLATGDCEFTIYDARNFFQSKLTQSVSNSNLISVINDIVANNWLGEQSVYLFHWFILDAIIFGNEVLGIDVNRLVIQVAALWNDPDSDWSTLCTSCGWTYQVLIGQDDNPITQGWVATFGEYNSSEDNFIGEKVTQTNVALMEWTFDGNYTIENVFFIWSVNQPSSSRSQIIRFRDELNVIQDEVLISVAYPPSSQSGSINLDATVNVGNGWKLQLIAQATEPTLGEGQASFDTVIIQGTGINPFP